MAKASDPDPRVGLKVGEPDQEITAHVFPDGVQYDVDPATGRTTAATPVADVAAPDPAPPAEPAAQ